MRVIPKTVEVIRIPIRMSVIEDMLRLTKGGNIGRILSRMGTRGQGRVKAVTMIVQALRAVKTASKLLKESRRMARVARSVRTVSVVRRMIPKGHSASRPRVRPAMGLQTSTAGVCLMRMTRVMMSMQASLRARVTRTQM
jgi:hypothetical protein